MPLVPLDDRKYLEKQYKDSTNLQARSSLHQRFSVNKYGWQLWVFDHFDLPAVCRILELGCGPGTLWLDNLSRIPTGWEITLSDFSAGMLEAARQNLSSHPQFQYKVIDAQSIPIQAGYFDAVIANHMLYHVPNRPAALAEIRRVLKPAGRLYASTAGDQHLVELAGLVGRFNHAVTSWGMDTNSFTLENGIAQLSPCFTEVKLYRYKNCLEVTEAAPLVDYILSGRPRIQPERQSEFREFVAHALEAQGSSFHVTIDSGLFVAVRKGE
jgi:ubiquinone/menaquinone biosynthesis C-methylase UbiE